MEVRRPVLARQAVTRRHRDTVPKSVSSEKTSILRHHQEGSLPKSSTSPSPECRLPTYPSALHPHRTPQDPDFRSPPPLDLHAEPDLRAQTAIKGSSHQPKRATHLTRRLLQPKPDTQTKAHKTAPRSIILRASASSQGRSSKHRSSSLALTRSASKHTLSILGTVTGHVSETSQTSSPGSSPQN